MKKKILLISSSSDLTGGAEDDFVSILKFLSKKKDEYSLHAMYPKGPRGTEYELYTEKGSYFMWGIFPVIYVSFWRYIKYLVKFFIQSYQIIKFIAGNQYDICIVNVVVLIWPIIVLKLFRYKVIVMVKETIEPPAIRKIVYRFLSYIVDHFIANSKIIENEYREMTGKSNISTVYSAVIDNPDISEFKDIDFQHMFTEKVLFQLKDKTKFKLFCIGNIKKIKNQMLLLKSFEKLNGSHYADKIQLFMVGETEEEKTYYNMVRDFIEKKDLSANVFILGRLNKSDTIKMYSFMNALAISSLSEGVPLVLVYALKYKKYIFSANIGGISDVIHNGVNGFLLNDFEAEFSSALANLYLQKGGMQYILENGYQTYLDKFNWEKNMQQIGKIINDNIALPV